MTEVLTSAQMRAVEKRAIASGAVSEEILMERAGKGVVSAIQSRNSGLASTARRAVVLCGPGSNGGDGYVIARLLQGQGWTVRVYQLGDPERLPPAAQANYKKWIALGDAIPLSAENQPDWSTCDLVVDALFGTGLKRPIQLGGVLKSLEATQTAPYIVAVDIPSGICSDSGRRLARSEALAADLTVTFHRMKPGHLVGDGPLFCGELEVCDIGLGQGPSIPDGGPDSVGWAVAAEAGARPASGFTRLWRIAYTGADFMKRSGHKFDYGSVMVLTGGHGRGGAGRLAARAALRVGAGLVTVACPANAMVENAARLDAIMLREADSPAALEKLLTDPRINSIVVGPGFGTTDAEAEKLAVILRANRNTVVDADALTLLARHKELREALHFRCVLTPHTGEFARLFPSLAEQLNTDSEIGPAFSKIDATRLAAGRVRCTLLLKGVATVIASGPTIAIHSAAYGRSAPWLATAGSGDVLAGLIGGLMGRGYTPFHAAQAATWLHTEAARSFGPGLIAEDLPEELPKVFRSLGL